MTLVKSILGSLKRLNTAFPLCKAIRSAIISSLTGPSQQMAAINTFLIVTLAFIGSREVTQSHKTRAYCVMFTMAIYVVAGDGMQPNPDPRAHPLE